MQASHGQIQIRLVSRSKNDHGSRAILNEHEIVEAIQQRYGDIADVHIIEFNSSLSTAMVTLNATDVLIGMHGAGVQSYIPDPMVSAKKHLISE